MRWSLERQAVRGCGEGARAVVTEEAVLRFSRKLFTLAKLHAIAAPGLRASARDERMYNQ